MSDPRSAHIFAILMTILITCVHPTQVDAFDRRQELCIFTPKSPERSIVNYPDSDTLGLMLDCLKIDDRLTYEFADRIHAETGVDFFPEYNHVQKSVIFLFNGIDKDYVDRFLEGFEYYVEYNSILEKKQIEARELLAKFNFDVSFKYCTSLRKNQKCFEKIRRYFGLDDHHSLNIRLKNRSNEYLKISARMRTSLD